MSFDFSRPRYVVSSPLTNQSTATSDVTACESTRYTGNVVSTKHTSLVKLRPTFPNVFLITHVTLRYFL